jgi:PEP-CTERM/exosortase A-associated glycosyltransferase
VEIKQGNKVSCLLTPGPHLVFSLGVSDTGGEVWLTMRILHVLDHSLPVHSGYTFRTRAILREQHRLGWETVHLTSPKHPEGVGLEEEAAGWVFHRTPPPTGRFATLPLVGELALMAALERRIVEVAEQSRPDLLHAHSPALNGRAAIRAGRRLGIPVVYEVRAFWEDAAVDHGTAREGGLRYRASRALETWVLRRAAAVTCICEGLRHEIVGRGVPERRVTVIPNGVDLESFRPVARDGSLRSALGLGEGPVLGFLGSFYGYEGLDLAVEALAILREQLPGAQLLLVGGGVQEKNLHAQAAAKGLNGAVVFTGRVPHQEIDRYYGVVDLLVYPRKSKRITELVTPLKPLEAMAMERLVVASDVGGHRELIRDGETGRLFRAGDAHDLAAVALDLLRDRPAWPRYHAAGRRFVAEERSWPAIVARYRKVYADALGGAE